MRDSPVALQGTAQLVLPEPYVPYLPSRSPEVLVLAESQNLSDASHADYTAHLRSAATPRRCFRRLLEGKRVVDPKDEGIAVQPWDDRTLQVALRAALGVSPDAVAVSNAIPWSWTSKAANARPFSGPVVALAAEFWHEMLGHLRPHTVVATGNVAQEVLGRALGGLASAPRIIPWRLPRHAGPELGAHGLVAAQVQQLVAPPARATPPSRRPTR